MPEVRGRLFWPKAEGEAKQAETDPRPFLYSTKLTLHTTFARRQRTTAAKEPWSPGFDLAPLERQSRFPSALILEDAVLGTAPADTMSTTFEHLHGQFPRYYDLLGISKEAPITDIQRAYRKAQLNHHPDRVGNRPEKLEHCKTLNRAKDVLCDPATRSEYDRQLLQELQRLAELRNQTKASQTSGTNNTKPRAKPSHAGQRPPNRARSQKSANSARPHEPNHSQPRPQAASNPQFKTRFKCQTKPRVKPQYNDHNHPQSPDKPTSQPRKRRRARHNTWRGWKNVDRNFHPNQHDQTPGRTSQSTSSSQGTDSDSTRAQGPQSHSHHAQPAPAAARSPPPQGFSYITSCPCCGAALCPGASFAGRLASTSIPCMAGVWFQNTVDTAFEAVNNKHPGLLRRPTYSSLNLRARLASCTGDPEKCPQHFHGTSIPHQESPVDGNRDYIPSGWVTAYDHFAPPASMYPNQSGHADIRPMSQGWMAARWKCFYLTDEHSRAVNLAEHVCQLALFVQQCMAHLDNIFTERFGPVFNITPSLATLASAALLVQQIMRWCAASYKSIKNNIDLAVVLPASAAIPIFRSSSEQLDILISALVQIVIQVGSTIDLTSTAAPPQLTATLLKVAGVLEQIALLPPDIIQGLFYVFSQYRTGITLLTWTPVVQQYDVKPMQFLPPQTEITNRLDHCSRTWCLDESWIFGQWAQEHEKFNAEYRGGGLS